MEASPMPGHMQCCNDEEEEERQERKAPYTHRIIFMLKTCHVA